MCIANACHALLHGNSVTTTEDVDKITMFLDIDFPFFSKICKRLVPSRKLETISDGGN